MANLLRTLCCALAFLAALPAAAQVLTIHFLDVGQGDAALIKTAEGKTVLIDGGPPEAAEALARRVDALTSGPLDLMMLSHPHLDHLGGLVAVLERVGAKRYLEPGFEHPGSAYSRLLEALERKGVEFRVADREQLRKDEPLIVNLGGGATLTVLWPQRPKHPFLTDTRSDPNANSIVVMLTYGDHRVLFTGDAEPETEDHLLSLGADLRADVLKVGHHGSRFSSTPPFLNRIRPALAVISCGKGNPYKHPGPDTLERLGDVKARVLRTDLEGEITVTLSPAGVQVKTGKSPAFTEVAHALAVPGATPATAKSSGMIDERANAFAASKRSKVFHRGDCPNVQHIKGDNLLFFSTREAAAAHKRPAQDCKP